MVFTERILLTGGTGFFGRALLRTWLAQFYAGATTPLVTVLTRSPSAFTAQYPEFDRQPWLRLHCGNICEPDTLPRDAAFTHILHAAADSTLGPQLTPLQRYDQIVDGTRRLLDLAVACNARRFLLTSSGAVYGSQPHHLDQVPENWHGMPDPLKPSNAYGVAKRAAEHLCTLYAQEYGLQTVIARCFTFIGPDLPLDVHFAIGNFIRDALWRDEITVAGDGTPLRSYLDQQDLAQWLLALLERGQAGEAYNVGSDRAISIADLAHLVRDIVAPSMSVRILGTNNANNGRNLYIPSIQKAKIELDLNVAVPLEQAITNTAKAALQFALTARLRHEY